jgi:hypothetical protein
MQWFGRERLAQAHYRAALEHLECGDISKALWNADLAIHNCPKHLHAAKLREKLRGERDWDTEASAIRTYVLDRIAEENGIKAAQFGRPAPPFVIPDEIDGPVGVEETEPPPTDPLDGDIPTETQSDGRVQ